MALDATVAGASANSYLTVADADALARDADVGQAVEAWQKATLDGKERALIRATRDCNRYKGVTGLRWSSAQSQPFPRLQDVDAADVPYLHPNIRLATYEQALYVLVNGKALDAASSRRAQGIDTSQNDDGSWSRTRDRTYWMSQAAQDYLDDIPGYRPRLRSVEIARP